MKERQKNARNEWQTLLFMINSGLGWFKIYKTTTDLNYICL